MDGARGPLTCSALGVSARRAARPWSRWEHTLFYHSYWPGSAWENPPASDWISEPFAPSTPKRGCLVIWGLSNGDIPSLFSQSENLGSSPLAPPPGVTPGDQEQGPCRSSRPEGRSWPGTPEDSKAQAHRIHIEPEAQDGSPTTSRRPSATGIGPENGRSPYGQSPRLPAPHNGSSSEAALLAQISSLHVSPLHSTDPARGLPRSRDGGIDLGSEVYRMLREPAEPLAAAEPKQSGSFRYLQGMLEAGEGGERPGTGGPRNLKPTAGKLGAPLSGLQGLPECTRCGHGIVGTIVKARDKLYHPECFMCSDCGLNLKQRGYFFLDDRLYCESHAKARVKPPEGYDVVAVYPNAKVELV
ncbi:PDZ and LIM domain protein 4 isoform X1 [Artibeus jamaicensis]|uniref:PDZ and LIM domain protein 4 isoform X1 n=1 Tax=Artibeus jamaicensis TaxID=9417 RepID=UPI00235AC46E|nr:PDZ and LIM domain protein 4 isoform X1 [Artibeus jamaicensis]